MEVSIVIPAYNEEKRIGDTLKKVYNYCKKNIDKFEIIVVDDGSKDNTIELVRKFHYKNLKILANKQNKGKGYSVRMGIMESKLDFVLFSDSDLSTPIEELSRFSHFINEGYDIVIASRNMSESKKPIKQKWHRTLMGKIFPLLVNLFIMADFKDTQCGFKLFKSKIAKKIVGMQKLNGFAFDVEMLFIAKKMKCKIKEVPVTWFGGKESKVHPIKDPLKMLIDILKIRLFSLRGSYKNES